MTKWIGGEFANSILPYATQIACERDQYDGMGWGDIVMVILYKSVRML